MLTKFCKVCSKNKSSSEFHKSRHTKDGLQFRCKQCNIDRAKRAYIDKDLSAKKSMYEYARRRTRNINDVIHQYKSIIGCFFCKENCGQCLDFHHINKDEKEWSIGLMKGSSKDRIIKEIEKCVIVCANCHRKIHANLLEVKESNNNISILNDF